MSQRDGVVITGLGVISPLGLSPEALWLALCERRSGVGPITRFDPGELPVRVAGEVRDFEPKRHVRPRKSLKVMSRDMQFAVAAALQAAENAGLAERELDPERVGVVFGADAICTPVEECADPYAGCQENGRFDFARWVRRMQERSYPLGMLKTLPNLAAAHVSIALDARGPNNTLHHGEVSSLLAVREAVGVIERGAADVVFAGGASSTMDPFDWARRLALKQLSPGDAERTPRPFDLDRDGEVRGEGGCALVLERESHARRRRAEILARLAGMGAAGAGRLNGAASRIGGLTRATVAALNEAGVAAGDIDHVNAEGSGAPESDRLEAAAIERALGDVPVTAPKSFFGNLGAATGALEMAVSVLALRHGETPVTLNHARTDPDCPVNVVRDEPARRQAPYALLANQTHLGQAASAVIARVD